MVPINHRRARLFPARGSGTGGQQALPVSLIGDSFDGRSWHTGVLIELEPGWKTYWRMPGEAGIPPEFTWTTSAPADVSVSFPTPARYEDQSGETVGYEGAALFPVTVTPESATELDLAVDLFFAVCKDICIPASAKASITLGNMMHDPAGSARVEQAVRDIPASGSAVTSASLVTEDGKPVLKLELQETPRRHLRRIDDIGLFPRAGILRRRQAGPSRDRQYQGSGKACRTRR